MCKIIKYYYLIQNFGLNYIKRFIMHEAYNMENFKFISHIYRTSLI